MSISLTVFQGRTGDRNGLGVPGAANLGAALSKKLGLTPTIIGTPGAKSYEHWEKELPLIRSGLTDLANHLEQTLAAKERPLLVMPRCATALATIPIAAKYHPDACLIWFDAHADLNTPDISTTGYLGGMVIAAAGGLWDSGLGSGFKLDQLILAGVRDIDDAEQIVIAEHNVIALSPAETDTDALRRAIAGRPVYMHIDCDVLTPGILPTEYECPNGLSLEQLHRACSIIAENPVVGLEITEFQSITKAGDEPISPLPLINALSPVLNKLVLPAFDRQA